VTVTRIVENVINSPKGSKEKTKTELVILLFLDLVSLIDNIQIVLKIHMLITQNIKLLDKIQSL